MTAMEVILPPGMDTGDCSKETEITRSERRDGGVDAGKIWFSSYQKSIGYDISPSSMRMSSRAQAKNPDLRFSRAEMTIPDLLSKKSVALWIYPVSYIRVQDDN